MKERKKEKTIHIIEGKMKMWYSTFMFVQINAFTDKPFGGNPAAVCYLPMRRDDHWLQCVAKQFNLSETAFLIKRDSGKRKSKVFKKKAQDILHDVDEFDLRWFTPKVEVCFFKTP